MAKEKGDSSRNNKQRKENMKHIVINLTSDETLQLRRGGKIDYFYNELHIEIKGEKHARKQRIPASKKKIPVQG